MQSAFVAVMFVLFSQVLSVAAANATTNASPRAAASSIASLPDEVRTDKDGRIRTQLTPRNEVVLSSELSAKIAALPLREGDAFRAGQTLVAFDCTLFQWQLNKSRATLEAAQQTLGVNRRLNELNSVGTLEVQLAEARAKEGAAEVAYMQATVNKCSINAPFSGRVAKRLVAAYQYVTPGTPLLGIIDTSVLELQLIVPSKWLTWLKHGARLSVQVEEVGKTYAARIVRVGARIDPVSQTIAVTGVIDGTPSELLPGMSGWATFPNAK